MRRPRFFPPNQTINLTSTANLLTSCSPKASGIQTPDGERTGTALQAASQHPPVQQLSSSIRARSIQRRLKARQALGSLSALFRLPHVADVLGLPAQRDSACT